MKERNGVNVHLSLLRMSICAVVFLVFWLGCHVKAGTVNIELYAKDPGYSNLTIPSSYRQEYQITLPEAGKTVYRIISGKSASVSEGGLITPAYKIVHIYHAGTGEEEDRLEYQYGTSVIEAEVNGKTYRYSVTVKDYDQEYADQVMELYVENQISDSMSNMEKLEKIAKFPCQYDYSAEYSSATGMIVSGGGDCWASTDAILQLCKMVGFRARSRDASDEPGAGGGHVNVLVEIDGESYIVDAGYSAQAPRPYTISKEPEYEYTVNEDGSTVTLTDYNGLDNSIIIPEWIDGYRVTGIGDGAFWYRDELRSVILPGSIKKIGNGAFYGTAIQSVKIPEGIEEIQNLAFGYLIDYHGPSGSFGQTFPLEIIELPATLKTLGFDLSESVVFYHGTKEQWDQIQFTSTYKAPSDGKMFYSGENIGASARNVRLFEGKSETMKIYSLDSNITVSSSDTSVVQASVKDEARQYFYYRDGTGENVKDVLKTLQITGKKEGSSVITIKNGEGSIQVSVEVLKNSQKEETEETQETGETKEDKIYTVGNQKYKIIKNGESASILGASMNLTNLVIPDTVTINNQKYKVTEIADNAFRGMKKLKKVTIGKYVARIGRAAFYGDSKLTSIVVKGTGLKNVGKNALKGISRKAVLTASKEKLTAYKKLFNKTTGKTSSMKFKAAAGAKTWTVTFKNGSKVVKRQKVKNGKAAKAPKLTKKGYVLSWNTSFKKVTKNLTVKAVWKPELAKKGTKKKIGGYTYKVTKSSKTGGTVQLIGVSSKSKAKYSVPSSVKIGKYRFKITSIGAGAFKNCKKAKSFSLPGTIQSISKSAFSGTSSKATVTVPKSQYKKLAPKLRKAGLSRKAKIKGR